MTESTIGYVAPTDGKFVFDNVQYRGKTYRQAEFFEQLTPSMTQDRLAELYEQEKQKGNPVPMDLPVFFSLCKTAYDLRDSPDFGKHAERFKGFVQGIVRSVYPNTLTRVKYQPAGEDIVVHNCGTSDEYRRPAEIVGPDREIVSADAGAIEALTSHPNVDQVKSVLSWLNGTPAWLWRVNSKPKRSIDERVVWLYAFSYRLGVGAYRVPQVVSPAFRVLLKE